MKYFSIVLILACLVTFPARGANAYPDLLSNGGMEKIAGDLPASWQTYSIGAPAQFAVDASEHHSGSHCVRISATEPVRSYLATDYFPVGVGETFLASAWVKCQDIQKKGGAVILIAEYADSQGQKLQVDSCGSAETLQTGWQRLQKKIKVPEPATKMRLRMGFSYCSGTTWWDDASLIPLDPVAMQVDINPQHFVPGRIPINILNRAGTKGSVRIGVAIRKPSKTDPEDAERGKPLVAEQAPVELTGEPMQHVDVDISPSVDVRGKVKLIAMLLPLQGSSPIFSRQVDVAVPAPVTFKPLVPTHWAVEDDPAKIEGQIDVALSPTQRQGASLTVLLLDSSRVVRAKWKNDGPLADGIVPFSLAVSDLPIGEYQAVTQLRMRSDKSFESQQPWFEIRRSQARTTINAAGYPEIDGKAIYPLGVFNGREKEEGEAGFTVSHAYNATRIMPSGYGDDQNCKDFLDRTEKAGMHACCMVPLEWAFAGKWDDFRRRIRMFRNHPALLCWDEEEGVARGNMTLDALQKVAQIVHEEDPNHPLMIGDSRDVISRIANRANLLPTDLMDMGMWWWYPFPMSPRSGNALEGEEDAKSGEIDPPAFLIGTKTTKPIWTSLQAYKKDEKSRYPTAQEYRAQAYIGVISGAKGLMWYGGYVDGGIYHDQAAGHWTALAEVVKELRELSPVIMSPSAGPPTFIPKDAPISVALKSGPNGPVLLAANRRAVPLDMTFDVAKFSAGQITVLYENRSVSPRAGKLADHFDPLGVHVYQFKSN
jgi:hypothetical protein